MQQELFDQLRTHQQQIAKLAYKRCLTRTLNGLKN